MEKKKVKDDARIQGKVSGILNEREITINIGSNQGVSDGMKFKILADSPIEVTDPQTHETLGIVDREKVRVVTMEVQERFSICKTYRKIKTPGFVWPSLWMTTASERYETLKVLDSSLPTPITEEESYVKIGDRVIQLIDEDE
jgi:hypothetical protein